MTRRRLIALLVALGVQVALVALVAGPRLIVRVSGTEYRLATEPYDPIDPLRGAYVALRLRGLPDTTKNRGTVYVPLRPTGNAGILRGSGTLGDRPGSGPYLRCHADDGGEVSCGIESFFASQGVARRLGARSAQSPLTARVRVGLGGRAVLTGLE